MFICQKKGDFNIACCYVVIPSKFIKLSVVQYFSVFDLGYLFRLNER